MFKKILLLLLLPLTLCGCMLEPNVESLMSPPKLSKEQSDVYNALTAVAGQSIKLHYPTKGLYRSPFVFYDLDGDGGQEAIVFYYPEGGGANVRINVLENEKGSWRSVYDISGYSAQVEAVDFVNLLGSDGSDFVVGWQMYGLDENIFALYEYEGGKLSDLYSDGYSELMVAGVGQAQRLAVIQRSRAAKTAGLRLIDRVDGEVATLAEEELSANTESYLQILQGKMPDGQDAFFIDGVRADGVVTTQVVALMPDNTLQNLSYDQVEGLDMTVATGRREEITCRDIDGDGITEIPVPVLVPGYEDYPEEEQRFLISWCVIEGDQYEEKLTVFMNEEEGYYFKIPTEWLLEEEFTIYYDEDLNEYLFVQHLSGGLAKNRIFMKIRTCRQGDDRGRAGLESYTKAGSQGLREYYVYLAASQDEAEITVSRSLFKQNFSLFGK